jgi:hypothetical protein
MSRRLVALLVACASEPPRPAKPMPPEAVPGMENDATMVEPSALEAYRIEGSIMIPPDDMDKVKMVERNVHRVIATTKVCLSSSGEIASIAITKRATELRREDSPAN